MNASVQDDLEDVFDQYEDDSSQALEQSHIQHTSTTWNANIPPSSSLEPSAFDDPLSFLKVPVGDGLPEDDDDFPALGSVSSFLPSSQQVIVPPAAAAPTFQSGPAPVVVSTIATEAAGHDEAIATAYPVSTNGDITFLTNPWTNPEYQPLIQWVIAAADTELIKPFNATVPAHLKPASWKGFRKDDTKCRVNLGKDLGRVTETRLVLDARNLFMFSGGKKWVFMCPNCKRLGHSKHGKPGEEQFSSHSRTLGHRQYLYTCSSCSFSHQNFRPARLMELAMTKANDLGMDIFEYFLGDYDHVIDQIKKNFSNLDVIENDRYTDKVQQTKRENLEPFMGCRFREPDKKEKTKSAMSPTMLSPGPSAPLPFLPMPSSGSFVPQLPPAKPPGKRPLDPAATKGARKARKPSGSEVQVTMNKAQPLYPELEFWNILNEEFKSYIDSGTLTKEVFDNMIKCRNVSCKFINRCVPYSSQKGDRFSVQDGEMNDYDYVVRNCNKAIARVFCDNALVSQQLKDDCMDALGFGDEEIAALLSKPLPSAQPADRSEQVLKIVPRTGGNMDLGNLYRAGLQVASPGTAGAFTPSPIAGPSTGNFAPRNKSPLASGFATTFAPVRDDESLAAPTDDGEALSFASSSNQAPDPYLETGACDSNVVKCICAVPPPDSDKTIQCSLCKQWSHRVCYSIDTTNDIKNWCCKHCKPAVYQNIAVSGWTVCPLAGLQNELPCMCNNHYPLPFAAAAAAGTDIDYDDTNWVQCSVDSCGRLMHSKCYHPFESGKVHVLCPTCQEEDEDD